MLKNSKGCLEILMGIVVVILLVITAIVVGVKYFGLGPKLLDLTGINKPRDLGVKYANIDVAKVRQRIGIKTEQISKYTPVQESLKFYGQKAAKYSLTSEELTALSNKNTWQYYPFTNIQMKINQDGTVETAGIFKIDRVFYFAEALGYTTEQVKQVMKDYNIPTVDIPFYAKGTTSITNGKITTAISKAEIGRIPVPQGIVSQITPKLVELGESITKSIPGFGIRSLTFSNGLMNFDGTVPETQAFVTQ